MSDENKIASIEKFRTLKALGIIEPEIADAICGLEKEMVSLVKESTTLEAERDELREVMEELTRIIWDGCDIDGGDFQDLLEKKGLIVSVPASEDVASEYETDVMFVVKWSPDAREARQEGEPK